MSIEVGAEYEHTVKVTEENVAKGIGLKVLVFSTPSLVLCMEQAAHRAVLPYLSEEDTTVGGGICIKHLKATPIGMEVRCRAKLVKVEGRRLEFRVEAWDSQGKVGEGTHTRFVVNKEKFESKVREMME